MGVRGITKSLDSTSHLQALYERISKVYRASYRECLNIYLSQSGPNSDPTSGEWLMKGGRYFLRSGSGIGSILGEVVTSLQPTTYFLYPFSFNFSLIIVTFLSLPIQQLIIRYKLIARLTPYISTQTVELITLLSR